MITPDQRVIPSELTFRRQIGSDDIPEVHDVQYDITKLKQNNVLFRWSIGLWKRIIERYANDDPYIPEQSL